MRAGKLIVLTMMFIFLLTSVIFADTLQYGSNGAEVEKLQQQLKELGYFKKEITGYFGPATETAVKAFQKDSGISADGIAGSSTYKKLSEQIKAKAIKTEGEKIKKIQLSLIKLGLYKGKADGIIGEGTIAAVKKFQALKQLEVTGKLDAATEKAILSSNQATLASRGSVDRQSNITPQKNDTQPAADDETVNEDLQDENSAVSDNSSELSTVEPGEYLDWWDSVRGYFKIGTTAQVIDYRTGKTFNIKRTYGVNHADSETLTKEDTEIMKELWGGEWSWARRPVIIVINGKRIAASIAGMPHAGRDSAAAGAVIKNRSVGYGTGPNLDKIKGNGMDGHFDVHFLNSRTHGTNRKDSGHQNAVREAAGKL